MQNVATHFSLPLFAKELTELAMRRRTYLVRVIYAFSLLFACWLAFYSTTRGRSSRAIDYLGTGKILLWWIGSLQNIGLLLVLPALACDVITREKERQTIGLLFLTRLSPWTIVLEKFFSRLFPAICLLSISLPMLAISYSLGGVEVWQIVHSGTGLMTNAITLTAIAVACSATCRTTTAAFICTYLLATVTPLMVVSNQFGPAMPFDFIAFGKFLSRAIFLDPPSSIASARLGSVLPGGITSFVTLYAVIFASCLPSLVFATIYLMFARYFLISRAFKSAGNPLWWLKATSLAELLPGTDSTNRRPFRGPACNLPDMAPVAWRETRKRWLGQWLEILIAILCLVVLALLWTVHVETTGRQLPTTWNIFLWVATLLILITAAASLIAQERGQQTLFVLLTTPLSGAEIVGQKVAGMKSLVWRCLIPLGACVVLRMLLAVPKVYRHNAGKVDYPMAILNEATMLVIYPQVAIWMALYFSLKSKTTIAAIMKTIFSIAALCIVPWLILMLGAVACGGLSRDAYGPIVVLLMFGPADLLLYGYEMEILPPGFDEAIWPLLLNTLIHGSLWWWLRRQCLNNADKLLGRGHRRFDE